MSVNTFSGWPPRWVRPWPRKRGLVDTSKIIVGWDPASPEDKPKVTLGRMVGEKLEILDLNINAMKWMSEGKSYLRRKILEEYGLPMMHLDTEMKFDQEILGKLGLKREAPNPEMHDLSDMKTIPPTEHFTSALQSFDGSPRSKSLSSQRSLTGSTHSTHEEEQIMHSNKTLKNFAVEVRLANQSDEEKLYARLEVIKLRYTKHAGKDIKVFLRDRPGKFAGGHYLQELKPLLVFNFVNEAFRSKDLMLWGLHGGLDQLKDPYSESFYSLTSVRPGGYHGFASNHHPDAGYMRYLRTVLGKIRSALQLRYPDHEKLKYGLRPVAHAETIKMVEEGLDKHFDKGALDGLRRRCRPYDHRYPPKFLDIVIGYYIYENFLIHKHDEEWPKELHPVIHNLIKEWVGHRFIYGVPNTEDWWNLSLVRELQFV